MIKAGGIGYQLGVQDEISEIWKDELAGQRDRLRHVETNMAASDAGPLKPSLMAELQKHRWDRKPTKWSQ